MMKKESLEERLFLISLYDTYGVLLSKSQKEAFEAHYFADLSFSEISSEQEMSRAAVADALKKAVTRLKKWEKCLHEVELKEKALCLLEEGSEQSLKQLKELLTHGI